jgi:hypothetical protein
MTPVQCLGFLESSARQTTAVPKAIRVDSKYLSPGLRGRASFDYSNNNGSFVIGNGRASFETKWSKASDTSIHIYRDGASIDAIALARGAKSIADVADASSYDFSSRARTANVGQVVIWRNKNGLYAATQVMAIKDDCRNGDIDEVVFDYVILPDGGSRF